jgi:hypothetical protein
VNPFYQRQKMSLRANNLNTPTLKVNDRAGNPVEVAAVVVWRVADTARAAFDVEDYANYIVIQSESAVRSVVSARWYDGDAEGRNSLRGDMDARRRTAGDTNPGARRARRSRGRRGAHLAPRLRAGDRQRHAPPATGGSGRRPPAPGSSTERSAWSSSGIEQLEAEGVVRLSAEDRVRLVTNLMTVLVSESETHPVLSVGRE